MSDETVRFSVLCSMFQAMLRSKNSAAKRRFFRKFLDFVYTSRNYFSAIRLILPSLDRERGSYGLKESVLATCLIDALGISRDSEDAVRLINWRKGGVKAGANAGNFALVAAEVLQRRQGMASGGLTIKELNDSLDRLASSENREEKTSILSDLIKKTNALEMKWIIMIILKDLKLGVSEKSIFHEFHPDAEDLFNVTCDLKLVCEKLKDRDQRHKRQDIEVGKAVRPQLAMRVSDAATAWKKLHGKQVVVECKFDGDRIQIHKNGTDVHFFSRNFIDHPEYGHSMTNLIIQNIQVNRCILDGEMLVWDMSTNRFAEFGSNQEIAKAAKEGLQSDRQLCYVAFDILYVGDTSVIHQILKERHELLQKVVKPLKGRLEILVPNGGLNVHRPSGEPCWSLIAYNVEDIEKFFKETIENRDEGIVLKDLGSKWEPSDRSGKWLKLKPDYIRAGSDLDVLIIGGYFGSGRRGGEVAQFLVALAEQPTPNAYPKRFISFCRVGTGLSDDELDTLVAKLKPYFRKNEHPKKAPSYYEVTNNSKERPDVWIDSPEKSIILSITSDIRTIKSEVFAAPYSLRFPRIDQVRYDKPWHECLDVQSFVELVHSSNGNAQRGTDLGGLQGYKSKPSKSSKKAEKKTVVVPAHLTQTDVSGVKGESYIFTNMMFYFVNAPPSNSIDSFHKLVAENGGTFSMNLNDSVTHVIAAEKKGIKYQAAMRRGDIIHYSWVLDCCSQKRLLHLQPKYFLFLADSSKHKLQEEVDAFSDSYFWDLDIRDLKQLFSNMDKSGDHKRIDYYKKKYCPMEKWCLFQDCRVYFHHSVHSVNANCKVLLELSMRRMKLEVPMYGGEISEDLSGSTHLLVFSIVEKDVTFDKLFRSVPAEKRHLLHKKQLHVLGHRWLEDSLDKGKKLQEDAYTLKPEGFEESDIEDQSGKNVVVQTSIDNGEKDLFAASPDRVEQQKRGRPTCASTKRGRAGFQPAQSTRARHGSRLAKIDRYEPENSFFSEGRHNKEGTELESRSVGYHGIAMKEKSSNDGNERLGSSDNSSRIETSRHKDDRSDQRGKYAHANRKRGRVSLQPAQRTRARHGNRPAKIDQNGSENSSSSEERSNKEETELKSVSGDYHGIEMDEKKSANENKRLGSCGNSLGISCRIETTKQKDVQDGEIGEGSGNVQEIKAAGTNKAFQEDEKAGGSDNIFGTKEDEKGTKEKLELMVDPVQAMLLDMIPTLSQKTVEMENSAVQDEKLSMDLEANPVKKKKVSYKDVASQLLKDW